MRRRNEQPRDVGPHRTGTNRRSRQVRIIDCSSKHFVKIFRCDSLHRSVAKFKCFCVHILSYATLFSTLIILFIAFARSFRLLIFVAYRYLYSHLCDFTCGFTAARHVYGTNVEVAAFYCDWVPVMVASNFRIVCSFVIADLAPD